MSKILDLIEVGHFSKAIGVKGQVKCKVEESYLSAFEKATVVFARIGGQPVPFFVESIDLKADPVLKVEDLNSKEEAQLITGKALWMKKEDLPAVENIEEVTSQFQRFIGYTVKDHSTSIELIIEDFEELPQQILVISNYKEQTVFIPFAPQLIIDIDEGQKTIIMDLPEGLLDLN